LSQPGKVVAVLAANPALSSVLTMVLRADSRLRVRPFESEAALATYMRIAPVDVLVVDLDREDAPGIIAALRADIAIVRADFQAIALTRTVTTALREKSIAAGIDEVIVKPMSPRYLLERVIARLERDRPFVLAPGYRGPERRNRLPGTRPVNQGRRLGDNVVELFPQNA
jgi:Response regulators consisting of a CheY-like receiver domain and a winged-helix DNA-binding domain